MNRQPMRYSPELRDLIEALDDAANTSTARTFAMKTGQPGPPLEVPARKPRARKRWRLFKRAA